MRKIIGDLTEKIENIIYASKKPHEKNAMKNIETFITWGLIVSIFLFVFGIFLAVIKV